MHEWRVTKYDPRHRDASGAYRAEDWTSWSDIGRQFGGAELTLADYLATEDRYVAAALAFFRAAGVPTVTVEDCETVADPPPREVALGLADLLREGPPLADGMRLREPDLARACRLVLRELAWCRFEAPGRFFLHVGYDYYMYVGSRADLPDAREQARLLGLFVEPFPSPYLPRLSS